MDVVTMPAGPATKAEPAPAPDICVILNPGSGARKAEAIQRLETAIARHPGRFTLHRVARGGDLGAAADRALNEGFATVVAAGGDGTICAIAQKLAGSDRQLGVLPMGTFNYFARGLGLPEDLEAAVDVLVEGATRPVDVGEVNGRVFLNNASLGLYPAILQQRETTYRRWGRSRLAAHWSVLKTFVQFHRSISLSATIDGVAVRARTPLVFVARSDYQLRLFGLDGADCVRDGHFALFLAPDSSRWRLLLYTLRLAWGGMKLGRDFELFCGDDIVVATRRHHRLVARDGERERLSTPLHFRIRKGALRVVVPREAA